MQTSISFVGSGRLIVLLCGAPQRPRCLPVGEAQLLSCHAEVTWFASLCMRCSRGKTFGACAFARQGGAVISFLQYVFCELFPRRFPCVCLHKETRPGTCCLSLACYLCSESDAFMDASAGIGSMLGHSLLGLELPRSILNQPPTIVVFCIPCRDSVINDACIPSIAPQYDSQASGSTRSGRARWVSRWPGCG